MICFSFVCLFDMSQRVSMPLLIVVGILQSVVVVEDLPARDGAVASPPRVWRSLMQLLSDFLLDALNRLSRIQMLGARKGTLDTCSVLINAF
jgi:hypothetical protein